jgi:hypothetical protein
MTNFEKWKTQLTVDECCPSFVNENTIFYCAGCPARRNCSSNNRAKSCGETFKDWAYKEVKDDER